MSVEKQIEGDREHMKRFGETLGLAVETSKVVTDRTVGALNQMSL